MNTTDPAFLWETEALRERRAASRPASSLPGAATAGPPPPADPPPLADSSPEPPFVTLTAASNATGIPVNTLRKWARRGAVVSYLDESGKKPIRMVSIDAVRSRAAALGREISALAGAAPAVDEPSTRLTVDLTQAEREEPQPPVAAIITAPSDQIMGAVGPDEPAAIHSEPAAPAEYIAETHAAPSALGNALTSPPGTMIVPISAWEKMLLQLGNLHEAGRDMAEARERAAKAETEAAFLRERLKELRGELERTRSAEDVSGSDPETSQAGAPSPAVPTLSPGSPETPAVAAPSIDRLRRGLRNLGRRLRGS